MLSTEIITNITKDMDNSSLFGPITPREQGLIEIAIGMALGYPTTTIDKVEKSLSENLTEFEMNQLKTRGIL